MTDFSFTEACALVERALAGSTRQHIVDDLARSQPFARALARLREHLRANAFDPFLDRFDHRTRQEGFHVLHDWDGRADRVADDTIPVNVLDYVALQRGRDQTDARALALLLDYYYFHVLQLLALRAWDDGDADASVERLDRLLETLQGAGGSGQRFVTNAATLVLIATSHFEAVERGYDRLLRRVKALNGAHRTQVAVGHASSMGCHLRFGFEATYARDTLQMRDDNVADYPWLCFALATVMEEYARLRESGADADARAPIVEAMVNGLSADARAFVGEPPASLSRAEPDRAAFRDRFLAHRGDLVDEFERHRPRDAAYSPLSFFFNFSHNVVKGTIVDAALRGAPWDVAFNDMLTGQVGRVGRVGQVGRVEDTEGGDQRERLARTLMEYARANPDRIRGQLMPVIVYDPRAGHRAFRIMLEKLAPSP